MKRSKQGFSLTELLTVVAIMGILMAVAVPALTAVSRNLKMRDLDDTARAIFLAAQNTLTAQKASGTVPKPAQGAESGTDCYWLFDDAADNRADLLLPDGAVEPVVAANHIAIWYNAESAMVLEVYYGEKNGSFASPGCDWVLGDIRDGDYSNSRNQSGNAGDMRAEKRIGYYDGTDLPRGAVEQLLPPLLEIVNGDILAAKITVPKALEYWTNGVTLTVTVEELNAVGVLAGTTVFTDLTYSASDGTYELVLDSLTEESQQFKNVCSAIQPGANIRVTAKLSAPDKTNVDGTVTRYLSARGSDEDNSLFADRRVTSGGKDTVYIANARHLKNLNAAYSTSNGTFYPKDDALFAEQTENIEWPAGIEYPSIPNGSGEGEIVSFNGKELEIKGLQGKNGLFANAGNAALTGIRIVNPQIENTGGNVGALAGEASGAVITDCRVYATTITADRTSEDYDALGKKFVVKGETAGGLIGSAESCTIRSSFAALSQVSGTIAGGFIGNASGCDIAECYATAEDLDGTSQSAMFAGNTSDGSVKNCYAVGNISGGTTISGFANGTADITDSYCAVTYESGGSLTIKNGFADGSEQAAKDNRYLRVSGNIINESGAVGRDGLLETEDEKKLSNAQTHPYRSELDGQAYPFFGLGMPHYGSWPVQTVDGIKLFDGKAAGSRELKYILVPKGGSATFWVEAQSDDKAAMVEPEVGIMNGTVLSKIIEGGYEPATGRKSVTVKGSIFPGTTYVDLTAEGITLRVVVVVYEAEVTLQGKNKTTGFTATGKADQTGTGSIGHLSLRTDGKVGEFTAITQIVPTESSILSELSAMQSSLGAQGTLSATAADFDSWKELKDGDPAVTANGNPGAGSNILEPVDGNYYPTADSTGTLTVTGVASGTATVSARWAIDEKVAAKCDVKMEGARALIQAVSATGEDDSILGAKDNYPYYLGIRAEPGETVSLSFTPKLFGGSGTEQSYTWTISGGALKTPITATNAVSGGSSDEWPCSLKDNTGWHTYTVKLEYTNDLGERSVDYMTFSVYCAAKKQDTAYGAIKIEQSGGQGFLNGDKASVEQINGSTGSGYEHTAELELQSWVEGAENTRVKWFYSADGGKTWSPVTGQLGSIPVYEPLENGTPRMRATVQWMNGDLEFNGKATGGAIRIVGLDANEYDSDFTFKLKAEAAEATENGEYIAAARTVDVTVMRKLKITPESLTTRRWGGNAANQKGTFNANREDALFDYIWFISIGDSKQQVSASAEITVSGNDRTQNIELHYGPHTAKATFTNINLFSLSGLVDDIVTGINWDVEKEDKQYFLAEKGKTKELDYSWGCMTLRRYDVSTSPVSTDYADIENTGSNVVNSGESGSYTYSVTGKKFTENEFQSMTWVMKKPRYWAGADNISSTHYLAVVGMDLKQGSTVVSDSATPVSLPAPGKTTTLTADWSFPADLMDGTEPTITWTVDNPELVAFGTVITSEDETASGESVSIVARKYSATDYSATITATCTIKCVNGRKYTYKKHVSVVVPPASGMTVTVEPCIADDIAGLNGAFGDGLTAGSLLAAVDGSGTPVLIRDSAFGCDTLYLKIRAGMSSGFANLKDYFCNLYIDRSFVDMDTALSSDGKTMYVRLKAKEATADVCHLELRTAIGSAQVHKQSIDLYAYPEVALTRKVAGVTKDVTNGSIPVYLDETDLSVTLNAALTPILYSADDTEKEMPLDQIQWYLQGPDGYDAQSYLKLSAEEGNEVTLSIRDAGRMPDFRVVLHARSARSDVSDAGYALVFLPVTKP